ncbi:hypothetical protein, partial [Pseudomonas aeruginosa]|uniref:hypothetical protein n=1 Tax=Pseudomonas aeruginosa TaxID=287 RepID=UPI0019693F9F
MKWSPDAAPYASPAAGDSPRTSADAAPRRRALPLTLARTLRGRCRASAREAASAGQDVHCI